MFSAVDSGAEGHTVKPLVDSESVTRLNNANLESKN